MTWAFYEIGHVKLDYFKVDMKLTKIATGTLVEMAKFPTETCREILVTYMGVKLI